MAAPAWIWPASGQNAPTVALAPLGSGFAALDWRNGTIWPVLNGAFGASGLAVTGTPGFAGAVSDGATGFYGVTSPGALVHTTSGSVVNLTSGKGYIGVGMVSGVAYALASDGKVFNGSGAAVGAGFAISGCADLAVSGNAKLLTLLPASGLIGTYAVPGGTSGTIALTGAVVNPMCIAQSGAITAVGGYTQAALVSGQAGVAMSVNPANTSLMLGVGSGVAVVWLASGSNPNSNAWAFSTSLAAGLANLKWVQWVSTGVQALATDPVSGVVQVLGYSLGALSLSQTLSVAGAGQVVVMPNGTNALVAQPASNRVQPLTASGSTWSVSGATVSGLASATALAVISSTRVAAGFASGFAYLDLISNAWSIASTGALAFNPSYLAYDSSQGVLYAAASGQFAAVSGTSVIGSGTWAGGVSGLLAVRGQLMVVDPTNALARVFGAITGGVYSQGSTISIPGSPVSISKATQTIFVAGSGAIWEYNLGAPYTLDRVASGAVGLYNGSTWAVAQLGVDHVPSALAFDASGVVWCATSQNDLYSISGTGTVLTTSGVPQYSGRSQTIPLGVSALQFSGTSLYAGTSMPGTVIQVT